MSKENLTAMKVDELRKLAAKVGVKNAKQYKKAELIEAILRAEKSVEADEQSAPVQNEIDNQEVSTEVSGSESENESDGVQMVVIDLERKIPYIEQAEIGSMVAFKLPNGKVKSAKMINRSVKKQKVKLETAYGKQFVVSYEDVIWVRTNDRWPRGVYNMLKGETVIVNG